MITHLMGFLSVVLIDLVLSGDNALVIGMACAALPPRERRLGILYGSLAAIGLRVVLAAATSVLLRIPLLQALGGLLLLWVAYKLAGPAREDHTGVKQGATVWEAVRTIAVADVIMSLDNVLAVGGVSGGNLLLLVVGLGLTIPIIMWGSGLVSTLLSRAPWLSYAGAAVLAITAAGMIVEDPRVHLPDTPLVPAAACVLVLGAALWDRYRTST
ncbi:MAG TPA: YjbE family putative metal transport protein [Symbiobacteriaceae bacterium]|jgi:YjbE family integral membrane protein|nr:YjbE family putative metal transport protein [Symbiobacteriaceae bacterium]